MMGRGCYETPGIRVKTKGGVRGGVRGMTLHGVLGHGVVLVVALRIEGDNANGDSADKHWFTHQIGRRLRCGGGGGSRGEGRPRPHRMHLTNAPDVTIRGHLATA